jgi:hypothetical protein
MGNMQTFVDILNIFNTVMGTVEKIGEMRAKNRLEHESEEILNQTEKPHTVRVVLRKPTILPGIRICPTCKTPSEDSDGRFCQRCGTPLPVDSES